ncbi:HMA2 domain-containing protein [Bacillus sp. S13(2024)]|uniref:HMA2 domain-containing protein n=1 Tax=unclassified Bacillus (in: firmicutes) TaxID=185979 RepID=UPI003D1A1292
MGPKFYILHDIPGRLRLQITALRDNTKYDEIQMMFSSLKGIQFVRIQPLIQTMLIQYDVTEVSRNHVLKYVSLFFHQTRLDPLDDIMIHVTPSVRSDVFRSLVAGALLLFAYIRKPSMKSPDALVYGAVIATGYAVLSHGNNNKLRHPDILTGVLSILSFGPSNMLQVAMVTWAVNVLELLHEMRVSNQMRYTI